MVSVSPRVFRLLALAMVAVGFAVVCACGGEAEPIPSPGPAASPTEAEPSAAQEPPTWVWEPTGEYRAERMGIGLTVHSNIVNWDYMAILYSVDDSAPGLHPSPVSVGLTDDIGHSYDVVSNAVLGSTLGVTAGLLIVEPYKGEGKTLTLTVTDVTNSSGDVSPGKTVAGDWSVTFIENLEPGVTVDYTEGGRISPEVMSVGELTMAVGGPPGGRLPKLLIDRGGEQDALYGRISDGVAQRLTEEEFHQQVKAYTGGANDYPAPRGWPAPAEVP